MAALDPIFDGFIHIRLSSNHRGEQLCKGVVRHLKPPNKDAKVYEVARHHFHLNLLKKHLGSDGSGGDKRQMTAPISADEAEEVGIYEFIDKYRPSEAEAARGLRGYVQVPNITRAVVGDMIKHKQTSPPPKHFADVMAIDDSDSSSESDISSDDDSDVDSDEKNKKEVERLKQHLAAARASAAAAQASAAASEASATAARASNNSLRKKLNTVRHRDKRQKEKLQEAESPVDIAKEVWVSTGGLNRGTFANDRYHEKHPTMASHWFGFDSWKETKEYISCLFPWVVQKGAETTVSKKGEVSFGSLTDFEKCLLTKIRFHVRGMTIPRICDALNLKSSSTVSKAIHEWGRLASGCRFLICLMGILTRRDRICTIPFQ